MKFKIVAVGVLCALATVLSMRCASAENVQRIVFDSSREVSSHKIALQKIDPDLPSDWSGYNFMVLEYRISTAQPFHIGLNTETGYNELRIMSYVPNAWNRIVIPLQYFCKESGPKGSVVLTSHRTRDTGWINVGGASNRYPLVGINWIGLRMKRPIEDPVMEIRAITLSTDDPGDAYLEDRPALDEFGQSNLVDYPEKIHSLEQLEKEWAAEESEVVSDEGYNYSKFGGYRQKQVEATGFFRTELIDNKWWFVDPEGYLFLSVGVDCIRIEGGRVNDADRKAKMGMVGELPPAEMIEKYSPSDFKNGISSYSVWNLYRRYGEGFPERFREMTLSRMDRWGVNTLGNWTAPDIIKTNSKPFILQLENMGYEGDLMGLCDVYDPEVRDHIDKAVSDFVAPYRDNPWLIGYFLGNEPAWLNKEESLCRFILKGKDRPIKTSLDEYLKKYGDTSDNRRDFVLDTFEYFLEIADEALKKHDPNHLNLGIRFSNIAGADNRLLKVYGQYVDVVSFNMYAVAPDAKTLDRVMKFSGRPMIIGEYHFGTVDRGMAPSLIQVNSQEERGVAYRYYTERGFSHPGLIGMAYFQWCDQNILGRGDGENYNCGLLDVTDRPYKDQVNAMMETAKRLYDIHSGNVSPVDQSPKNACGLGVTGSGNNNF